MLMLDIKIQSISDIITNSSSETFCRISSEKDLLQIYEFLREIFPETWDSEMEPYVWLGKDDYEEITDEDIENCEGVSIHIDIPYSMNGMCNLLEHGLAPMLEDKFPNSNFEISYD